MRRAAGDADPAAMDAVEVVGGAEAGEVLGRVVAPAGAEADVVDVERGAAAAGDLAEVAVACEDPLLEQSEVRLEARRDA